MNIELLQKVRDYIHTHPDELNMERWCGTTRCIAGTAVILSPPSKTMCLTDVLAQKMLDLTGREASRLFYRAGWYRYDDRRFSEEYAESSSAKTVCDYIDVFIAHNGEAPAK